MVAIAHPCTLCTQLLDDSLNGAIPRHWDAALGAGWSAAAMTLMWNFFKCKKPDAFVYYLFLPGE